ncbi:MAG: hypothetical protein WAO83_14770 [Fuerstiella sp.]
MSTIRFVHADHLRLAGSPSGIADAPAWLRQLACDSVRSSVRNVIEAAVSSDAEFLLIAGRITESSEDLEAAINWLDGQFEALRRNGVRVVATARNSHEADLLRTVCDVVVQHGESLLISADVNQTWRLAPSSQINFANKDLVITFDHVRPPEGCTTYTVVPSMQPSADRRSVSVGGHLSLSAGAVQPITPTESWAGGCVIVDANVASREIRSEFLECDVLRYATEELNLTSPVTAEALTNEIARASEDLRKNTSQTVIVDWRISAELLTELSNVSQLDETSLLIRIRGDLQAGHRGSWPRRVTFCVGSRLQVNSTGSEAVEEFVDVVSGAVSTFDVDSFNGQHMFVRGGKCVDASLVAGLQLLGRVA